MERDQWYKPNLLYNIHYRTTISSMTESPSTETISTTRNCTEPVMAAHPVSDERRTLPAPKPTRCSSKKSRKRKGPETDLVMDNTNIDDGKCVSNVQHESLRTSKEAYSHCQNYLEDIETGHTAPRHKYNKASSSSRNCVNMVNILQINKDESGNCTYRVQQVKLRYKKGMSVNYEQSGGYFDSVCHLHFNEEGNLENIEAESLLRQGLYLVENWKADNNLQDYGRKLTTSLLAFPPDVATMPNDCMCIAVGDLYPETQKDKHRFQAESNDAQTVLVQFMPNAIINMNHRFHSVIALSMSPRCSSPQIFYSEKRRDVSDNVANYAIPRSAKKDLLADNMDTAVISVASRSDPKRKRASERVAALNVKRLKLNM